MALGLVGSACGVNARGELTANECRDKVDNDHDDMNNCADPDCWVYDFCSDASSATQPEQRADGAVSQLDSGVVSNADAASGMPSDASQSIPPEGDASAVPLQCGVDGGIACADNETCVLGACVADIPASSDDTYVLRISAAYIPDQTKGTICFDTVGASGVCSVSPAFICGNCKPDPYVVTLLNEMQVAKTSVAMDTVAPAWSDPGFEVTLKPNDVLQLVVMDSDPTVATDDLIFSCTPSISIFKTASAIQCQADPGAQIPLPPPGGQWAITIESSPRGPVAE